MCVFLVSHVPMWFRTHPNSIQSITLQAMNFKRVEPKGIAAQWVESYWIIESDDPTPHEQKIIPDGYPEIIFHFGDAYRVNISGIWETQAQSLFAGQIRQHFFLENTGRASMLGIKLKPVAPAQLFGLAISNFTDRVVPLNEIGSLEKLENDIRNIDGMDARISNANNFFSSFVFNENPTQLGLDWILKTKGATTVQEISRVMQVSERHAERLFQKYVGLSPKFYCRIIRFNTIFHLLAEHDPTWAELAYDAGFTDQSHFIRNFKAFTGEDPSAYGFDEKTLANFFLKKK